MLATINVKLRWAAIAGTVSIFLWPWLAVSLAFARSGTHAAAAIHVFTLTNYAVFFLTACLLYGVFLVAQKYNLVFLRYASYLLAIYLGALVVETLLFDIGNVRRLYFVDLRAYIFVFGIVISGIGVMPLRQRFQHAFTLPLVTISFLYAVSFATTFVDYLLAADGGAYFGQEGPFPRLLLANNIWSDISFLIWSVSLILVVYRASFDNGRI